MSDALTIYVYRQLNGWGSDIWRGDEELGGCTAPTLAGCMDTTYDIIADSDPEWADFNSNEDYKKRSMNAEIVKAPVKSIMNKKTELLLCMMLPVLADRKKWLFGWNAHFKTTPLEMIIAGKEQEVQDYLSLFVEG